MEKKYNKKQKKEYAAQFSKEELASYSKGRRTAVLDLVRLALGNEDVEDYYLKQVYMAIIAAAYKAGIMGMQMSDSLFFLPAQWTKKDDLTIQE